MLALGACAPALPDTVVPGTRVTVGWDDEFTSANADAQPTPGNLEIGAATRAGFGSRVDGEFVADDGFGVVTIVGDDPFTVRYDLAEPSWSDGIPLDAADLVLGWAAASGLLTPSDEAAENEIALEVPVVDEFARAIEVTYPAPVWDWQERIGVAVPAHVVGQHALGLDDAMEAKQAVITAVLDADVDALAAISEAWNEDFTLPESGEVAAEILLSSGPFRVEAVHSGEEGQSVTLVPNAAYRGVPTPQVASIDLVPAGDDPLADIGGSLDIAFVAPTASNRDVVDALERRDAAAQTPHDGTVWAVHVRPTGLFAQHPARAAFLRAIPARSLIERGAGEWASAYAGSTSMLSAPGTRSYDIAGEDAGFATELTGAEDSALERTAAGVATGASVCVLYDRRSEFAAGAFAALRDAAREAGWGIVDCGTDDMEDAAKRGDWNAVIAETTIPQSPADIAAQWDAEGEAAFAGAADPMRDDLIEQLAQTTDVYAAREVRAQIEATIVQDALALPIAVNPRVVIIDSDVAGVTVRAGTSAPVLSGATGWAVSP